MRQIVLLIVFIAVNIASADPIKVGMLAPLSGDFASYGKTMQDGVNLAVKDLARAGIEVKAYFQDACLGAGVNTAVNDLIGLKHIDAIVGNFCVAAMPIAAPLINQHQLFTIHSATATDKILNASPYILSINGAVKVEAEKIAEYAALKLRAKTAAIYYIGTDFGEDYQRYFNERFSKLGGTVVGSYLNAVGDNDFRSAILLSKAKQPDVIFAVHLGNTLGLLLKQIRQVGMTLPVLGVYEAEDPSIVEVAGKAAEGLTFYRPDHESFLENSVRKHFVTDFKAAFGYEPGVLAANAYDGTILAVQGIKACQRAHASTALGDCVAAQIKAEASIVGASGSFNFSNDRQASRGLILMQVTAGQFVKVASAH
ncbi:ABC transporter substrate-binding protein [bacterium]|nr:ABC transporter substrate-binding protein [bacterium]